MSTFLDILFQWVAFVIGLIVISFGIRKRICNYWDALGVVGSFLYYLINLLNGYDILINLAFSGFLLACLFRSAVLRAGFRELVLIRKNDVDS
jgi:nicotinamide riboside transporter PnuC